MSQASAKIDWRSWGAAGVCALAGLVLFQFFGNAARGYVDTSSVFWWWVSQWLDPQAETEHGWLVLGISAWVLWRNLGLGQSLEPRAQSRRDGGEVAACGVMVIALGVHAVGFVAQQARISIVAVLLFAWGVLRLGGGKRWGDAAMFPLGFMVFAIPVNVLDSVGFWLRLWVIEAAGPIAQLAGIDVVRSGTQLFAPDGRYQYDVAAACSGVRSLMALAALSLLVGYLNFRSWWRRGLMLALCFPLTYVGNVVRICAIIFAAQAGGQVWGERAQEVTAVEREILPADTGFSRRTYVKVSDPRHAVLVSVVLSGKDRTSIHRPELCLVGQGWTLLEKRGGRLNGVGGGDGLPVTWLSVEAVDGAQKRVPAVVGYWFVNGETAVASHWERFFHDAWNRLRGRADRWAYVLVQTDAVDGEEAARGRMREVLAEVLPKVQVVW